MPRVKVGDINMYYEIHGSGEPFVYLNGFGANTETLTERIAAVKKEYRVIIYDPRGVGRSDAPDIPYPPHMMAGDLAGLLDAIGIKAAHICGESFGGMIAQHFALDYPHKVISLILRCTTCGGPHAAPRDPEYVKLMTMPGKEKLPVEEINRLMLPFYVGKPYLESHPKAYEEFYGARKPVKYPTSPTGYRRLSEMTAVHDTYDRLPEIKAPTLVIHGTADRMLLTENGRILASRIPGAELALIEDAGHFLYEAPEELNKLALEFLRKHTVPRRGK